MGRRLATAALVVASVASVACMATTAHAQTKLRFRGYVESDVRFVPNDELSFERVQGTLFGKARLRLGKHVGAVADLRFIFTEQANPQGFTGLVDREQLDPWRLESDELYVAFYNMGLDGLDLKIGRQQIIWGTADRFHPISNFNPLDTEDPLAFGQVIGNEMISLKYSPYVFAGDEDEPYFSELSIELVFVPFFKPAQLPASAEVGFTDQAELERRADTPLVKKLLDQQKVLLGTGWSFDYLPSVKLPERNMRNSMYGARVGFNLADVDWGFSYFRGTDDFPRAEKIDVKVPEAKHADSYITLTYPKMHVLGIDAATSLPFLDGLGLWAEVGVTFHDDLYRVIDSSAIGVPSDLEVEIEGGSFVKATVGMDYTPLPFWYINIQYLHGFLDEFGSGNLENYLVAGMDFKLAHDVVLIRLFGIVNLDDGSFVLFPQLTFTPFSGGEITLAAFLFSSLLSDSDPSKKFESPAVGDSTILLKARASF